MADTNIPAAQPVSLDIAAEDGNGKADGTVPDSSTSIFSWIIGRLRTNSSDGKPSTGTTKRPVFKAKPYSEVDRVNLHQMEQIINFRDLLAGKQTKDGKSLKSDIVFRSGTLDNATAADAERVLNVHKIQTIVDLRRPTEQHPNPHLHAHFAVSTTHPLDEKKRVLIPATVNGAIARYIWHKIDYSGPLAVVYWKATSIFVKIVFLVLRIFSTQRANAFLTSTSMSPYGLLGFNERLVDHAKDEIREALLVISHRENHPVVFHCSAGKDRAGLTAALVLYIAGVDESVISGDYTHTNREMAHLAPLLVKFLARSGMDESWVFVKEETMHKTFAYIRNNYGSVEAWLDQIGFGEEDRKRLRSACLEE